MYFKVDNAEAFILSRKEPVSPTAYGRHHVSHVYDIAQTLDSMSQSTDCRKLLSHDIHSHNNLVERLRAPMKPLNSRNSTVFAGTWAPSSTFPSSRAPDQGFHPVDQAKAVHPTCAEPVAAAVSLAAPNRAVRCICCHCHARTRLLLAGLAVIIVTACAALAVGVYFAVTKERGVSISLSRDTLRL